jgi:YHS domain-containing protein
MEDLQKKEIVLGLDISTTTIGCCLLINDGSEYGKIIELTHVSPKVPKGTDVIESLFLKTEIFREEFLKRYKDLGISKVVIEAPLLTSNNSVTCGILLRFNGMISLAVYEELGVMSEYISSYDARKYSFPSLMSIRKFDKKGEQYASTKILNAIKKNQLVLFGSYPWDVDKKNVIQCKVSETFPNIPWIYDKKGELKKENYDACDAYVALLGQLNKEKYGELDFKISDVNQNNNEISYTVTYWNKVENKKIFL